MKPTKKLVKLKLDKQVLRTLTNNELDKVAGAYVGYCQGKTYAGSGCSSWVEKCWLIP